MEDNTHITSCLHPIRVRNRFTNEMVTVSCGKCEACCSSRSYKMQQRLNMERMSWKYCVFVTLTYDNENLPILVRQGNFLTDLNPKRVHPILGVKNVDIEESLYKIHRKNTLDLNRTSDLIQLMTAKFGGLPYLSSVDIQRFIKRLRITISRKFKSNTTLKDYEKNTPSIRYFCAGEYGPTTFRPHYHLLFFFNSEFVASYITEFIRTCWKFGLTDSSFVEKSNSSYVAGYINSFANLPAIYQTGALRPFSLFSKHPALGTLIYNSETLKSQFLSCDASQCLLDTSLKTPVDVPLWRTFKDSLYPQLPYFSELSSVHRDKLYRICESSYFDTETRDNFGCFQNIIQRIESDYVRTYLDKLKSTEGLFVNKLYRWFSICQRVRLQSEIFNITIKEYVDCIERFYVSRDYTILKLQYDFEEKYSKEHDILQLIGIDSQFFENIVMTALAGYKFEDLDVTEQLYLLQFDSLDKELMFNDDREIQQRYLDELYFENSDEYKYVSSAKKLIYVNSSKTKKKNDYLLAQSDDFYKLISNY